MSLITGGGGTGGAPTLGSSLLIYRYTVSGSAKASIDTGVDTPQAGGNDWTNCDLIEAFIYTRTDETATSSQVNLTFNNDTGANYDTLRLQSLNAAVSGAAANAQTHLFWTPPGASATANVFGFMRLTIQNPTGTVGFKSAELYGTMPDETAANMIVSTFACNYRSTSAITRLAIIPNTAAKNFVVGSQVLIYKRLAS